MRLRRGLALLLFAALLLALFAPWALSHAHDSLHCVHTDCSACLAIKASSALLRFLSLAFLGFFLTGAPALRVMARLQRAAQVFRHITPVSLKVKMTN